MTVISEVEVIPLNIPFVRPFKISKGYVGAPGKPGEHIYIKLVTSDGEVGWGEARPMPSWMYETFEGIYVALERYLSRVLIGKSPFAMNLIHSEMDRVLAPVVSSGHPFAKSAVDTALHDLVGKILGAPIHALLGGKLSDYVEMSALISGDPESIGDYAREMRGRGYRCFKLKIMGDAEGDWRLVQALLDAVPDALIWLDANQAYASHSITPLLRRLEGLENVVCIEQPVPTHDFEGLRRIVAKTRIPIAVDESVFSHYDLLKLISMNAADLVVLKVAKSGLRRSLKICALAEAAGVGCMGSGMTESGVGLAASIHLFSTLKLVAPVDTNGPQFLEDLIVSGLEISGARVRVPDKPGLGVDVREDKLNEYRVELSIQSRRG
ncbi:MAG: muconate cycloisomerase [Thermoprotei archaeon]|nr:MAG: muconate cycloisomerase [Thermoprotei archaeon]